MKYIDLHTHSTFSDGIYTPTKLVKKAEKLGLYALALTDHDTISGLEEARKAAAGKNLLFINGIEFSVTNPDSEVHMVGLNFRDDPEPIKKKLDYLVMKRNERNEAMVKKLESLGLDITFDDVKRLSPTHFTGRSHIAMALVEKGYCKSVPEAFEKYLKKGAPAFIPRESVTDEEAINLIHLSGGKAIAAHLNQMKFDDERKFEYLKSLKEKGLDGIEGYYAEYTHEEIKKFCGWAEKLDLILSGGSDFHGEFRPGHELGLADKDFKVPYTLLDKILK